MAEILRSQNEAFGSDDTVRHSIAELESTDCVAVLTGQQVGLFTGPILTVYKALTALRLSAELRHKGFNSVAVFWMASDDHDLAETTRLTIQDSDHHTRTLDSRELLFSTTELPPHPVGAIRLPETVRQVVDAYSASFSGDWSSEIRAQLASSCRPGDTFAEAFGRLMAQLFRGRGLILFDSRDPGAKRLAAPMIRKALVEARKLRTELMERSRALKGAGLEPQVAVLPRSTLVFLQDEGGRRLLVTGDDGFVLKDAGRRFTIEELLLLTEDEPDRFSPNVLLRPVVQDRLFPTVAYVGGPAEVSYFAQVEPLYRFYGRPMPLIWPRSSFTVLSAQICTAMERHAMRLEDCFQGEARVIRQILEAQPAHFEVLLAELRRDADRGIAEVKPAMAAVDASLASAADTVRRKLLHRIASLQSKFHNFEMRRNSALRAEVSRLLNSCYPHGNLQERELGVYPLLARYGPSLLDAIYESVDLETFAHQILCI